MLLKVFCFIIKRSSLMSFSFCGGGSFSLLQPGGKRFHKTTENDLECLKKELTKKLSGMELQANDYVIPELFTKCHCKRSVILVVEHRELYVSKQILKLASPVFNSMFDSDFLEKNMASIDLPGKNCQEIVLLLSCLYPNMLEQIEG